MARRPFSAAATRLVRAAAILSIAAARNPAWAAPAPVPDAAFDPALFADLRWRSLGPFRAGRVLAACGVPGDPRRFYFGAVNGGVWRTDDAGRTWNAIFDGQPIGTIGALAIAPSDPTRIYVGSGEADMRSDIAQGDGVYVSRDAGASWVHAGLTETQQIGRILVDPGDAERVFVAALGHPYGPNPERGVFRSSDGGRSWQRVLFTDDDTGAIDLAFKPGDARTLYAALWQTRRPPWNVYPPSNGPGSGLYKSTDGGDHWTHITGGGFPTGVGHVGLAVAPSRPERVYAMVDAAAGGLYRSDDAGATWTRATDDRRIWERGWYFGGVTVDPRDADVVYALDTAFYRSTDAGRTFLPVKGAPGGDDYHALWIDAREPDRQILATDQGAVVTLNGGRTWSSWYNQPTGQFYHVSTDDRFPYRVYGAQQDSGAAAVPSRTTTLDGVNLTEFREITAGGENDMIAPDPRDPDSIFGGRVARLDLRTGQTHDLDPTLLHTDVERQVWTLPLVFSPRDPRVLYFARERLFRTEDGGARWSLVSPDLTREASPRRGVIYAIAPSRLADHDVWVGTDDGLVWRTTDEGAHWENRTPAGLPPWSKIGVIEVSHFDAETAYLAVDRHRLDDFRPYVYRTRDGGRTWTLAVAGIEERSFVNAVREDPVRRGLLYAATEKGVWVSFDDGDRWQPLQNGLPVTSVRDLVVHDADLVVATHGRGFWILGDVAPLRQLDAAVAAARTWLFAPETAVRLRPAGFTGTPFPKDEPTAPNPPAGAAIDYVVGRDVQGPIVIAVYDGAGGLVRRYSSADAAKATDVARIRISPDWIEPQQPPPATPGMHRFFWSLRYASEAADEDDATGDGVWAPPGTYRVELQAGGTTLSRPLVVAPDPRVSVTRDAYVRQFELARRVDRARGRLAAVAFRAAALHRSLAARAAEAGEAARRAAGVDQELAAFAGIVDRGPSWVVAAPRAGSVRWLADKLRALETAVDGADGAPTPDAEAAFARLEPRVAKTLAAWTAVEARAQAAAR